MLNGWIQGHVQNLIKIYRDRIVMSHQLKKYGLEEFQKTLIENCFQLCKIIFLSLKYIRYLAKKFKFKTKIF